MYSHLSHHRPPARSTQTCVWFWASHAFFMSVCCNPNFHIGLISSSRTWSSRLRNEQFCVTNDPQEFLNFPQLTIIGDQEDVYKTLLFNDANLNLVFKNTLEHAHSICLGIYDKHLMICKNMKNQSLCF